MSQSFEVLVKTLEKSKIMDIQNLIEIFKIKLYAKHEKLDVSHAVRVLEWIKEEKFDVVNMLTRSMFNKIKGPVVLSMLPLQKEHILVSPCVSTRRPPAPADFPCQMAIAVGLEVQQEKENEKEYLSVTKENKVDWQSCGSTLDFVCAREADGIK